MVRYAKGYAASPGKSGGKRKASLTGMKKSIKGARASTSAKRKSMMMKMKKRMGGKAYTKKYGKK